MLRHTVQAKFHSYQLDWWINGLRKAKGHALHTEDIFGSNPIEKDQGIEKIFFPDTLENLH